jgi:hypothetical protein
MVHYQQSMYRSARNTQIPRDSYVPLTIHQPSAICTGTGTTYLGSGQPMELGCQQQDQCNPCHICGQTGYCVTIFSISNISSYTPSLFPSSTLTTHTLIHKSLVTVTHVTSHITLTHIMAYIIMTSCMTHIPYL